VNDDNWYHVGLGLTARQVIDHLRRGLPVYLPTDPKPIDQTPYLAFAAKPEGAPK
jgi:hypothetical protein